MLNLDDAFASFDQVWLPHIVAKINDYDVRIARADGDHTWHVHDDTDEFFLVLEGELLLDIEEGETVALRPHQGFTVPRGVVHRTRAPRRTSILMVEREGVAPTGD